MRRSVMQAVCLLLSMVLLLSVLPGVAFGQEASEMPQTTEPELNYDETVNSGSTTGEPMTVKVIAPDAWEECYVYTWPTVFGGWPGQKLDPAEDGSYSFALTEPVDGIVLSAGDGMPQTQDITSLGYDPATSPVITVGEMDAIGKHVYTIEGGTVQPTDPSEPGDSNVGNSGSDTSVTPEESVPQEPNQPVTVELPDGPWPEDGDDSVNTLFAWVPDSWGSSINAYTWEPTAFGEWPGSAMTEQDGWYRITLPENAQYMIINNGNGEQTYDMYLQPNRDVYTLAHSYDGWHYSGAVVYQPLSGVEMVDGLLMGYCVTDDEATLIYCDPKASGVLELPAALGEYPVTGIGKEAFVDCYELVSVNIPQGVTHIDRSAFTNCSDLEAVILPDSLVTIDSRVFRYCQPGHVFYRGTQSQWDSLMTQSNNHEFDYATIHYDCTGEELQILHGCTCEQYSCSLCGIFARVNIPGAEHQLDEAGLCLDCGAQMQKIYFDGSGADSVYTQVHCTAWDDIGSYPDVVMTGLDNDLYTVWVPENITDVSFSLYAPMDGYLGWVDYVWTASPAEGENLYVFGHDFWTVYNGCDHSFECATIPATCKEAGAEVYTCTLCGAQGERPIEKLGHQYVAQVLTEATCTEPGKMHSACSLCGEVLDWEFPAIGHNYVHTLASAPTCSEPGQVKHTCAVCGDSYTDSTLEPLDAGLQAIWDVDAMGQSMGHVAHCVVVSTNNLWREYCGCDSEPYGCSTCTMTVPGDVFEAFADRSGNLSLILEALREEYGVTYHEENHTYTFQEYGGYGGFTNDRVYAGFVNNGNSIDVYYEYVEKEWAWGTPAQDYLESLEEYPASFEYDGKVYYDFGCGEYGHILSHTNSGNKYTLENYEGRWRIVSIDQYTPETAPEEFSESLPWDLEPVGHSYVGDCCQYCGIPAPEVTVSFEVSGTGTGSGSGSMRLELFRDGEEAPLVVTYGKDGSIAVDKLTPGNYLLKLTKEGYVPRTCEVSVGEENFTFETLLAQPGDVTGDGRLNVGDVAKIYAHSKRTAELTDDYQRLCADYNDDGRINVGDAAKVYALIKSK